MGRSMWSGRNSPFLQKLRDQKEDIVAKYVAEHVPEYRRLLNTDKDKVLDGLSASPKPQEIEASLGRVWVGRQAALKEQGKRLLAFAPESDTFEAYKEQMDG